MSDLHWCTFCDNAISPFSASLYCSEQCLRSDALRNHPLLGYDWKEFVDFPRPSTKRSQPTSPSIMAPLSSLTYDQAKHSRTPSSPALAPSDSSVSTSPVTSPLGSPALSACTSPPSSVSSSIRSTAYLSCPKFEIARSKKRPSVCAFLMTPVTTETA